MVKRFAVLVLLMVVAMAGAGRPARADSAPLKPLGRSLQPVASTNVRMESERIEINVSRQFRDDGYSWETLADVRVQFHFGPSADESMEAGFPLFIDSEMIEPPSDFSVKADGKVLPQVEQAVQWNDKSDRWAVWKLDFHKGQPLDLEVAYKLHLNPMGKTSTAPLMVGYILKTGAFWAGTIGRADAVIRFDRPLKREDILPGGNMGPYIATTPGWQLQGNELSWTWTDLEPDFDLQLWINNFYYLDLPDEAKALLAKKPLSRADLLKVASYVWGFLEGDGRVGMWENLRGRLSGEIGLEMLPEVLDELDKAIAANPADYEELGGMKLRLVGSAYQTFGQQGPVLVSADAFRRFIQEVQAYDQKTGKAYMDTSRWAYTAGFIYAATKDPDLRRLALEQAVKRMPESFPSELAAEMWIANQFHLDRLALEGSGAGADMLKVALTRVVAQPPAPVETPPTPAPAQAPEPAPPPAPEGAPIPWAWIAGGGAALLLGAAGYLAFRRRNPSA